MGMKSAVQAHLTGLSGAAAAQDANQAEIHALILQHLNDLQNLVKPNGVTFNSVNGGVNTALTTLLSAL